MKRILIFLSFCLTLNVVVAQETKTASKKSDIITEGQYVPTFDYLDFNGKKQNNSSLKGKVVMYTFFATWCGPCRKELPEIEHRIWKKYRNNDQFELLVFGREHTVKEVTKYRDEQAFSMHLLADPKREIYSQFARQFIPRIYLADKTGKVILQSKGYNEIEFKKLLKTIEKAL